jgi:PKD repeat protein
VISGVTPTGDAISRVTRISFDGRQSRDPEQQSLTYSWDFGDGSPTASGSEVTHVFTGACACRVRLTVTDPTRQSDTTQRTVTSKKLDGPWTGAYGGNAAGFTVQINQGDSTHFDGGISDNSTMDGTLSDPRHIRFAILNTPSPPAVRRRGTSAERSIRVSTGSTPLERAAAERRSPSR